MHKLLHGRLHRAVGHELGPFETELGRTQAVLENRAERLDDAVDRSMDDIALLVLEDRGRSNFRRGGSGGVF